MSNFNPDERIHVATVCGNGVRVYQPLNPGADSREFAYKLTFPHYGAAKLYADEYEDSQRKPPQIR